MRRTLYTVCALLLFGLAGAAPCQAQEHSQLRLAAYNIKHGLGMDGVVDLERVADVLRALDADVITLQEMDRGTERTDGVDQATRLGELLGMSAYFGDFMPYQGGHYGMAVLSRLPVVASHNHRLPDGDEPRTALEVRVAVGPDQAEVSVVGIHFYRTVEERLAQAQALAQALSGGGPAMLIGDFNSRRGDPVMDFLAESWSIVDKDGPSFTFPSDTPAREIDFVLVRPTDAFEVLEHRVIDEKLASDHRPLLVVVRLR